ncbi:4a-hydroxytetrahydrobiopterin dehydratase [Alkalibacillus filiformis]|uniref:Putative pterin-4-alpha-carbinolamine dehydratase n=1 Tax=Alkalibacillus filiformis TaxID=200990 RepID=A0ABU0DS95_9BACI|nr:4a-hydroxytetrahydrobiopterin dehydratase [Alkalibacillus filiformis]MDQ0351318.1 4a-hydroxytetrahydrobiopterin dehydratase [Alkalibacillus filiformis]
MAKLSDADVQSSLEKLTEWELEQGRTLKRQFKFDEYLVGIDFVRQVANQAEAKDHHPHIVIDYKTVTVKWTSWDEGGITEKDLSLAKYCDELYGYK